MSHSPPNAGFFDTIQVFFLEETGRHLMFSARDMALLTAWRDKGVSAAIICRGIKEALSTMGDDDPPRGLYQCERWIEEAIEQAKALAAGGRAPEAPTGGAGARPQRSPRPSSPAGLPRGGEVEQPEASAQTDPNRPLLEQALANVERAGRACDDEARRAAYREAWSAIKALIDSPVDDPFSELAAIEDALVDGYFRALDHVEQDRIEEAITAQNRADLAIMSPEARREHLAARRRRLMMRDYGLAPIIE